MAKGKKKGGSKGKDEEKTEVPSVSSLSISEAGPSTSQAEPEDEGLSLGMTSAAARRKAKKAAKAAPIGTTIESTSQPEKPSEPPAEPTPVAALKPEPKTEEKAEEDDGLGLGLGGGGKRRPRKKKSQAAQEAAASQEAAAVPAVSALAAAKPVAMATAVQGAASGPAQPRATSTPSPWGSAGRGRGRGDTAAPANYPGQQGPGYPQQPGPPMGYPQQPGPPMGYPQQPAPPMGYPQQPGPPMGYPQQPGPPMGYPQQPAPPMGYPQPAPPMGYPQQPAPPMGYPQPAPPMGYPQQPAPPMGYPQQPGPPMGYPQQPAPPMGYPQQQGPPRGYPQQVAQHVPQPTQQPAPQPAVPPATQREGSASSSSSSPTSKTLCRYKIPRRIDGNTVPCTPVRVITNYLEMKITPLKIYRYDVAFKPDKPKKCIPKAFQQVRKNLFPKELIAFDQMKNCYAKNALPNVPMTDRYATEVEFLDDNGKTMKFEVSFKFTGIVDLSTIVNYMKTGGTSLSPPTEAIQCVDVILRQGTLESYIKAGRQFFKRPYNPIDLGYGLEMWTGLFQSAIFTTRPFINVDVAHKGFPKQQNLLQAFMSDFNMNPHKPIEQQPKNEHFQSFLKGLKVVAYIGGDMSRAGQKREFIVNGLSEQGSDRHTFSMDLPNGGKKTVTVLEYFQKEKNCRVQYPRLNCVWVGPRDKNIYYPMELLDVAYGHARNRQLNEKQLATMVKQAATPPDERKRKIEEVIKDMNYPGNKDFKQFGLEISDKFFAVQAKVLPPPQLETGDPRMTTPRNGAWNAQKLLKAEALQRWGFIVIDPSSRFPPDYGGIIAMIKSCGIQMGMTVTEPVVKHFNLAMNDLEKMLVKCVEDQVKFLFIVVPGKIKDCYHQLCHKYSGNKEEGTSLNEVKKLAERTVGILTQCIKEFTAEKRMNPQTVRNILLKVNSKLMGINQALDNRSMPACLKQGRVMVVGADVTHPSPDQSSTPSIAAVTASIDPKCFIYNIALSIQTPKKEMIVEFEDMMVEHLTLYRQRNGALPTKIFVFRDGVSEGQFAQVMNSELLAVHQAYQRLAGTAAKPEVLFLLVQKRHHTRLFFENNPRNVEPGTVVDRDIVHATELDFYLVSHQAIKGTARPTRYHAVCNDGGLKHDEVEQLTYYLCHLYSRCMRSVSYPTPTYYAHLACLRARSLTYREPFDNAGLEKEPKRLRVLDKMLQYSRMFFV